jgi:diguanylate cyclase (GGDEF)-like protein/PAS domain S-box-containing protein
MTEDIEPKSERTHQGRPLAALASVGRSLSGASSLQDAVPGALRTVCEACEVDLGVLWWVDPALDRLRRMTTWRPFTPVDERVARLDAREHLDRGQDVPGRVWESGNPEIGTADGGGASAAFPVRVGSRIVGVLEACRSAGAFPEEAIRAFDGMVAQLGVLARAFEAEQTLRETSVRYRLLVEQIPAIVYTERVGQGVSTLYVSPQVEGLLGIEREKFMAGRPAWERHVHPDDRERARDEFREGVEAGLPFAVEYRMVGAEGRVIWFRDEVAVVPGEGGSTALVHGVMLDVTERKRAEEQVEFLAFHDKLTGLANRAMLEELLELAIAKAAPLGAALSVLYLDLDDFKTVNDSLGHEAGDELLRQIAGRLRAATRDSDLVARQGGDEFLLLLSDIDRSGLPPTGDTGEHALSVARSVSDRIRESLHSPFTLSGTELFISASIGISVYPVDAPDARSLLRQAHAAMYQSKRRGPGGADVYTDEGLDATVRLSFSTRLRKAVEQKHWEMHYQPILDLVTTEMVGVEALIRWRDPAGGLIAPGEFIPLAEEIGLILPLGEWAIRQACTAAAAWPEDLRVAVNLSAAQFRSPGLVQVVISALAASGLAPQRLELEITESILLEDSEATLAMLFQLREMGVRIAMDDFGTGYSSLSYLQTFPFDKIKIDRTFVKDITQATGSRNIVRAVAAMAKGFGMEATAEGVETPEQLEIVKAAGYTEMQGFLLSRPLPADDIGKLLHAADATRRADAEDAAAA